MRTVALFITVLWAGLACAQSLGDVARANRAAQRPKAPKVITNDDVAPAAPQQTAPDSASPQPNQASRREKVTTDLAAETQKQEGEYRKRAQEAKLEVVKLQTELNQLERDRLVHSTNYYMDPASRLRDPRAWSDQRKKMDEDIATKTKDLEAAKQKLADLRDEARKAGIPASVVE